MKKIKFFVIATVAIIFFITTGALAGPVVPAAEVKVKAKVTKVEAKAKVEAKKAKAKKAKAKKAKAKVDAKALAITAIVPVVSASESKFIPPVHTQGEINIKLEGGRVYIKNSLVPKKVFRSLVLTVNENCWGQEASSKNIFKKEENGWWSIDVNQILNGAEGEEICRFNAKVGEVYVNPRKARCGPGLEVYENLNNLSCCFALVKLVK